MRFTLSTVHRFALRVAQISLSARSSHWERSLHYFLCYYITGFPMWLSGKESACQCRRCEFSPWVRKMPWRREWQPTPVFLPGESHEQRSLAGYSPGGHKELDTTYQLKNNNLAHRLLLPLRFFHEQFLTNLTQSTSLCPLRHGKYL